MIFFAKIQPKTFEFIKVMPKVLTVLSVPFFPDTVYDHDDDGKRL